MKTANGQLSDRNEQIDKLNQRLVVLENYYDENQQIIAEERKKNEDAMEQCREQVKLELTEARNSVKQIKFELDEWKLKYNRKARLDCPDSSDN